MEEHLYWRIPAAILLMIWVGAFISCEHESLIDDMDPGPVDTMMTDSCDTMDVTFSEDILPVVAFHCQACHSGPQPEGGIDLSSHMKIATQAVNGRLLGAISHEPGIPPMPQGADQLDSCTIALFHAWVDNGAPDN